MNTTDAAVDLFYTLMIKENEVLFTPKEQSIYDVFLDGLSLCDALSIEARKDDLKARLKAITDCFQITDERVLLDAGCGIGHQSLLFSLLGAKKVIGIDIIEERLKIAQKRKSFFEDYLNCKLNIDFINDDIYRIIDNYRFDMIYCKDAISHIHPLESFIEKSSHSLKNNGVFIIEEPNQYNPFRLYSTLTQHYKATGTFKYYTSEVINPVSGESVVMAEERLISSRELKCLLRQNSFSLRHLSWGGGWLIPKSTIARLGKSRSFKILKGLERAESFFSHVPVINLFFGSFLLIAEKIVSK